MRSVVGLLPIAIGLFVVCGCALPDREIGDTDKYGFRSKLGSRSSDDVGESANDRLAFVKPQKKRSQKSFKDENLSADSDLNAGINRAKSDRKNIRSIESNDGGDLKVANDRETFNRGSQFAKANDRLAAAGLNRVTRSSSDVQGQEEFESPIFKGPVQLQALEIDRSEDSSPQSTIISGRGRRRKDENDQIAGTDSSLSEERSQIPRWSDRPSEQSARRVIDPKGSAPIANSKVLQTNATSGTTKDASSVNSGSITATTWQAEMNPLIARIEEQLSRSRMGSQSGETLDDIRTQAYLRLLYLIAQRQEDALTAIPGLTPSQQEYWQQMIWALFNSLDTDQFPDPNVRAAHAIAPLSSALRHLREDARLTIKNMAFCKKISGFGNYDRFPRNEFPPGYEVLLYSEVENFVSAPSDDGGYRTSLKSTIEIFDSKGNIVWTKGFAAPTEDFCRNPRRDYFQNCHFHIPNDLATGEYVLVLTISDELDHKTSSSSLKFVLK